MMLWCCLSLQPSPSEAESASSGPKMRTRKANEQVKGTDYSRHYQGEKKTLFTQLPYQKSRGFLVKLSTWL
ncbi:hypothetical protein BJX62DRAFT_57394 [Aspergillus germanicus]